MPIGRTGFASTSQWPVLVLCGALMLTPACRRRDATQVPAVTVGRGLRPLISWTPSPAYLLHVYEGTEDRDGVGVLWTLGGSSAYANALESPIVYGVPPAGSQYAGAPPLVAGRAYTVTITRADEQGSGDGFLNTRQRYRGVKTFVAEPALDGS